MLILKGFCTFLWYTGDLFLLFFCYIIQYSSYLFCCIQYNFVWSTLNKWKGAVREEFLYSVCDNSQNKSQFLDLFMKLSHSVVPFVCVCESFLFPNRNLPSTFLATWFCSQILYSFMQIGMYSFSYYTNQSWTFSLGCRLDVNKLQESTSFCTSINRGRISLRILSDSRNRKCKLH